MVDTPGKVAEVKQEPEKKAPAAEQKFLLETQVPVAKPADRVQVAEDLSIVDNTRLKDAIFKPATAVMGHLAEAKAKADEINKLDKEHKDPSAKITVTDASGKAVEMTVDERVKQLKKDIDKQFSDAIKTSQTIPSAPLVELVSNNFAERLALSQKNGIDMTIGSPDQIKLQIDGKLRLDPSNKELQRLSQLHDESEQYRKTGDLGDATKMLYAQYMALGYTNEKYGLEKGDNGRMKVDMTDVQLAASYVIAAGKNPDFRENPTYKQTLARLGEHLGEKDHGESMTKKVAEAAVEKDPKRKEELLKQAVEQSNTIGLDKLARLRNDEDFMARQPKEVQDRLNATVNSANDARLELMRLYTKQGRTADAEKLMTRIKADDYTAVGHIEKQGDKEVFVYKNDEWRDLDNQMALGTSTNAADFKRLADIYNKKMEQGQLTSSDLGKRASYDQVLNGLDDKNIGADQVLVAMQQLTRKREEDRKATLASLTQEKANLEKELKGLGSKEFDVDGKREMEQASLENRMRVLEAARKQMEDGAKAVNDFEDAERQMLVINRHSMLNEKSEASEALEALKRDHPDYWAKRFDDEQRKKIEQACEYVPWYKDWRTYAIAGAAVVGAVVGFGVASAATSTAAVAGTAALLGVSTGVATGGLLVVGTVGGIAAGGASAGLFYSGAHHAADWMGVTKDYDKADFSKDFAAGWRIGSKTAAIGAAVPTFAIALGHGIAATGTVKATEAATMSLLARSGNAAINFGVNTVKISPLAFSGAVTQEMGDRWTSEQPITWNESFKNIGTNTAFNAAFGQFGARITPVRGLNRVTLPGPLETYKMALGNTMQSTALATGFIGAIETTSSWNAGSAYDPKNRISPFSPANGSAETLKTYQSRLRVENRRIPYSLMDYDRMRGSLQSRFDPLSSLALPVEQVEGK
ncbi:MAG: hypothetical protein HY986_25165 [Candidatus Melainabacteria bacterium]|nr:hypothetical protein [Candidatus Melainabacteria bacterium]